MFQWKFESKKAYELFIAGKKGDVIERSKMTSQINRECWTGAGYRYVRSGMERAIKDGVFWYRDKDGQRYVCGSIDDINKAQMSLIRQSARRARKSLNVAACCKTEEMNKDQLAQHNLNTLMAGLVITASSSSTRKQLEGRKISQPDPKDLLRLVTGEKD